MKGQGLPETRCKWRNCCRVLCVCVRDKWVASHPGNGGMGSERMVAKYVNILSYYYTRPLSASSLPSPPPSRRAQVTVRNAITGSTVDDGRAGFSSFFFLRSKGSTAFHRTKIRISVPGSGRAMGGSGKNQTFPFDDLLQPASKSSKSGSRIRR